MTRQAFWQWTTSASSCGFSKCFWYQIGNGPNTNPNKSMQLRGILRQGCGGKTADTHVKNLGRLGKNSAAIRWQDSCGTGEEFLEIGKASRELWELRQGQDYQGIAGALQLPGVRQDYLEIFGICQQLPGTTTGIGGALPGTAGNCGKTN